MEEMKNAADIATVMGFSSFGTKKSSRKRKRDKVLGFQQLATGTYSSISSTVPWLSVKNNNINACNEFNHTLEKLNKVKESFSNLSNFTTARDATNAFEAIGKGPFMNRSAMKLANIDSFVFNNTLALPSSSACPSSFLDLCGGPGGFSEYLFNRNRDIKGYGMTLSDSNQLSWNVDRLQSYDMTYCNGEDGTGNIYSLDNIKNLVKTIKTEVGLCVADGGTAEARDSTSQHLLMRRLLACQIFTMLCTLSTGGNFIIKTFEIVDSFTVSLVLCLYKSFEKIAVIKPVTSRPASSERYVICKSLQRVDESIRTFIKSAITSQDWSNDVLPDLSDVDDDYEDFRIELLRAQLKMTQAQLVACERILEYDDDRKPHSLLSCCVKTQLDGWNIMRT